MLTIFTAAKPFRGSAAIIQRNALQSWLLLHEHVQIILFGDAQGSQEVSWELGLHFEQSPKLTSDGAVRMDYMFARAQQLARFSALCYLPCDTMLLPDFCRALNRVEGLYTQFVMAGQSCDLHLEQAIPFVDPNWQVELRSATLGVRESASAGGVGYIAFSKGLFLVEVPALSIDGPRGADWLLRKAKAEQVAVVDASEMVLAVRQNCDVILPLWEDAGAGEGKMPRSGGQRRAQSLTAVTYLLTPEDIVRIRWYRWRYWQQQARKSKGQASAMWRAIASRFGKALASAERSSRPAVIGSAPEQRSDEVFSREQ